MSLTKQVQQLLPLQPRCSTLEVERDTAQHKLDRLQVSRQMPGLLLHGQTTQNGQCNGVCNSDMAAPRAAVQTAGV